MKRFREDEGIHVANWLMLLSRGGGGGSSGGGGSGGSDGEHEAVVQSSCRVFECKTCNRQFPSFQALGGHRASHKKPRSVEDHHNRVQSSKPRVHECSICGLEFAIGQALGGHMRRHRNAIEGFTEVPAVKKLNSGNSFCFDLNLPPSENESDFAFGIRGIPLVH